MTLEEFYESFRVLEVSALKGLGFEKIMEGFEEAKKEYYELTLKDLKKQLD